MQFYLTTRSLIVFKIAFLLIYSNDFDQVIGAIHIKPHVKNSLIEEWWTSRHQKHDWLNSLRWNRWPKYLSSKLSVLNYTKGALQIYKRTDSILFWLLKSRPQSFSSRPVCRVWCIFVRRCICFIYNFCMVMDFVYDYRK